MPDLDRALRELLTDEHLEMPARPDAVRILHDGVRRRRRRRAIAMSTAVAATVGAVLAAAATVPAALDSNGRHPTTPAHSKLRYDVPWISAPAPRKWAPKRIAPKPPTMNAPRCTTTQLRVGSPSSNGATGMLFITIPLRNIGNVPCQLIGKPARVAAQAVGKPAVIARRGLHLGSSGVGGDLQPGKGGYLTIETDRDCPARYANPDTFPTNEYSSLSVTLPSDTSFNVPMTLDVECGLRTGGLGINWPQPTEPPDPRGLLQASIDAPSSVRAGESLDYVVTLTNPTESTISLRHCPGYLESLSGSLSNMAKQLFGLNCSTVASIAAGQSVRYEMRLAVPADAHSPDPLRLAWYLQAGVSPHAVATVTLKPSRGR